MKKKYNIIIAAVLVTGCSTIDEDFARFETFDCYALAKETGRYEAQLKSAKTDETIAILDQILGDKEDRDVAIVDEIVADIDGDQAREYLNRLNQLKFQKRCRF